MRTADPGPRRVGEMSRRGAPATRAPPGRTRLLAALRAGLGRHGPPRAHRAFVCGSLGTALPRRLSRQTTARARCAGFLLASAAHAPAPGPLVAGTCPGAFGAQPGACERVPRARLSVAGRSRAAAWPSGLSHTRARAPAPWSLLLLGGRLDLLGVDS